MAREIRINIKSSKCCGICEYFQGNYLTPIPNISGAYKMQVGVRAECRHPKKMCPVSSNVGSFCKYYVLRAHLY